MAMIALPVPCIFHLSLGKLEKQTKTSYYPHACLAPVFNIEVPPVGLLEEEEEDALLL